MGNALVESVCDVVVEGEDPDVEVLSPSWSGVEVLEEVDVALLVDLTNEVVDHDRGAVGSGDADMVGSLAGERPAARKDLLDATEIFNLDVDGEEILWVLYEQASPEVVWMERTSASAELSLLRDWTGSSGHKQRFGGGLVTIYVT